MTNQQYHDELQQDVSHTWNQLLEINKEMPLAKWLSNLQDIPKYSQAYNEWQKAQLNYVHFLTNSEGLKPHETFVKNSLKDFGVWLPTEMGSMEVYSKGSILHNSQPHDGMEKVFSGSKGECEKYLKENVRVY